MASDEDQLNKDSPWKPIETEVCGQALSVEEKYHIAAAYPDKKFIPHRYGNGGPLHLQSAEATQQASHGCFFSLAGAGCFLVLYYCQCMMLTPQPLPLNANDSVFFPAIALSDVSGAHEGALHHRVFFSCTAPGLLHMDVPNGAACT